jgi:hypothetical protein
MGVVRCRAFVRRARIVGPWWVSIAVLGLTTGVARAQTEPPSSTPQPDAIPTPQDDAIPTPQDDTTPAPRVDTEPQGPRAASGADPHPGHRFVVSLGGGFAYRSLYGVPMTGVDLEAMLGSDSGTLTIGADLEATHGVTEFGLINDALSAGVLVEGHYDRLRIGGGARVGVFNVDRATDSGGLFTASVGFYLRGTVDLYRFDEASGASGAIFLALKGSVDAVSDPLLGAVGGAGVRF